LRCGRAARLISWPKHAAHDKNRRGREPSQLPIFGRRGLRRRAPTGIDAGQWLAASRHRRAHRRAVAPAVDQPHHCGNLFGWAPCSLARRSSALPSSPTKSRAGCSSAWTPAPQFGSRSASSFPPRCGSRAICAAKRRPAAGLRYRSVASCANSRW